MASPQQIKTTVTDLLKIKHPVLLAGMGGASGSKLAAAVTNAGGMGVIGGNGYTPSMLKDEIAELKSYLHDKNAPFGVDLLIPQIGGNARKTNSDYNKGKLNELIDVMIEAGAKLFALDVGKGVGGGDFGDDDPALLGHEGGEAGGDEAERVEAAVVGDDADEVLDEDAEALFLQRGGDGGAGLGHVDEGGGEEAAEVRAFVDEAAESVHFGDGFVEGMGFVGLRIECGGVAVGEAAAGARGARSHAFIPSQCFRPA